MKKHCNQSINDHIPAGNMQIRQRGLTACMTPVHEGLGGTFNWGRLAKPCEQVAHAPCRCQVHHGWNHSSAASSSLPILLRAGCWASWGPARTHMCTHTHPHTQRARGCNIQVGVSSCSLPSAIAHVGFDWSCPSPPWAQPLSKQRFPPPAPFERWPWPEYHNPLQPWASAESGGSPKDMFSNSAPGHTSPLWCCLRRKSCLLSPWPNLGLFWRCPMMSESRVWCPSHSHQCQKYARWGGFLFSNIQTTTLLQPPGGALWANDPHAVLHRTDIELSGSCKQKPFFFFWGGLFFPSPFFPPNTGQQLCCL